MIKVSCVNSVNNIAFRNKSASKSDSLQTNPQIDTISNVIPDYSVKTPLAYTKTGEIDLPYDLKAQCYKLSNGQKVIIVPKEGKTVVRSYVDTGSMNEPDNIRGISHYIEHNLFNGSQGLEEGEFFKEVNKMGASTNASTGFAETNYFISSNLLNEGDLENKIKLHASMLETPLFAIEKLEKEKGIVNSEINMITSDPVNIALNKTYKNLYNIKSSSLDLIGGTTSNITNLTREDVVNYYNNNYYPGNIVTVITGEVTPDETMKLVSKYFNSKKHSPSARTHELLNPVQNVKREDIISDKATATTIVMGFDGPKNNNFKDQIYLDALNLLLNKKAGRLEKKLDKYNAQASIFTEKISNGKNGQKAITVCTDTTEENSEKILKTILNELANLKNNPPSNDDMQIIKKELKNMFSNNFEYSFNINSIIGTSFLEGTSDNIKDFDKILEEMTPEDLAKTAQKYFTTDKYAITMVHPGTATQQTITQNYNNAINIPFTGKHTKNVINMNNVTHYLTSNNINTAVYESQTDNCSINLKIKTKDFPDTKPGVSVVLSHILEEGSKTKDKDEYYTELAKSGINSGFDTTSKGINAYSNFNYEDMQKAAETLNDVVLNPRFTPELLEKAKKNIRENILLSQKSPVDKLETEIYKELPYAKTKEEILKSLDTITLEDVQNFHKQIFENGKMDVTISAPFGKHPELKDILFNSLASYPEMKTFEPLPLKKFEPVEKTKVLTDIDAKNQADIIECYKFKRSSNVKDIAALTILNEILGGNSSSRLFMDLREKQKLAYSVSSYLDYAEDIGSIQLRIKTTTENKDTGEVSFDNLQKSINGFNDNINKLKTQKISQEELSAAKLSLKNYILSCNESSYEKISSLMTGFNTPYCLAYKNILFDEIDKITVEDIHNAANYIFTNKPVYSIVATKNTLKANDKYLKNLVND